MFPDTGTLLCTPPDAMSLPSHVVVRVAPAEIVTGWGLFPRRMAVPRSLEVSISRGALDPIVIRDGISCPGV